MAPNEGGVLLGRVDSLALHGADGDGNSVAVLKDTQLLEAFGFFERCDRPRDKLAEERRAIDVEPDVAKGRRAGSSAAGAISMKRNRCAGEIQRAAALAKRDFDEIWVVYRFNFRERGRNGRDIGPRRRKQEFNRRVDDLRLHFRFVALNVDEHISWDHGRDLREPRGAVWMVDAGQDCMSTSRLNDFDDSPIVGGNHDFIEASCLACRLEYMHNERFPRLARKHFFGKARRGQASGNNADGAWSHELLREKSAVIRARSRQAQRDERKGTSAKGSAQKR